MQTQHLNYDQIASEYNQRYPAAQSWERGQALLNLAKQSKSRTILEVGSGTGYWLNLLYQVTPHLYGMDFSTGMITQSRNQPAPLKLTRGTATQLPYQNETFDLLYCVDAIHHFGDSRAFISEAFRVLKPGGALAIIGHDPHSSEGNWYIYDYFDTVHETDLARYPSSGMIKNLMRQTGLIHIERRDVEHILNIHVGEGVFKDPFLKQSATSQLALLSEQTYEAGIGKIKAALTEAEEKKERIIFQSDIYVKMFLGFKPVE
jgi:ubiquinone/menaquinone biosynthesis C-methylase UbiE